MSMETVVGEESPRVLVVALRELLWRPYDLCISDLKMPVTDVLDLLERIAAGGWSPRRRARAADER